MIIISQEKDIIIDSKNVFSFYTNENSENAYLAALYGSDTQGVIIGKYGNIKEAKSALQSLFHVIVSEKTTGQTSYQIE